MRRFSVPVVIISLAALASTACQGDKKETAKALPAAVQPSAPAPTPMARVRHKAVAAATEVAGAIEDRFDRMDHARQAIKNQFAVALGSLLSSANNRSDYWTIVMDSGTMPADVTRSNFYDAHLQLTGAADSTDSCRFSPGDSVATYECVVRDPAPFSDLASKMAAYADASRGVIPASWILAGEDGAFHAANPFCRAEQIRFANTDALHVVVTLPYDQPCALPYSASTSKS